MSDHHIVAMKPSSSSWSRFKDPRVVRVPKGFGGKDRHSKVCTVRGLRDRRVRLSIPTAIQLYDLQDRLGLNQPSRVVDWLLDAAKHEIDELPPLHIPPGSSFHQIFASQVDQYSLSLSGNIANWNDPSKHPRPSGLGEKDMNWDRDDEERQFSTGNQDAYTTDGHNFSDLMSGSIPYNSYTRYEPNSSLSLSHPLRIQTPEAMARSHFPPHHQVLVCQHGMNKESYFQSSASSSSSSSSLVESSSSTQQVRPIHFMNMTTASLFPSLNDDAYKQKAKETYNHFR